MLVQDSN